MRSLRVALFALIFLSGATLASAQASRAPTRGKIGVFGAYAANVANGLDRGHGFGASITVFFSRLIGVEAGVRRQSFDVATTGDNGLSGGELRANVVTANVVVRGAAGSVQPYAAGGVAYLSNSYAIDPVVQADLAMFNFAAVEAIDTSLGFNFAAGVDVQASPSLGFFVEGRYIAATADTTAGLTDLITQVTAMETGRQDVNVVTVVGGLRIFF